VKSFARKLRWPPTRLQAIWGVVVIAVLVGMIGFVTSGVIAGLSLLLGFPGVLSLILLFLPSRPRVAAALRGTENAITGDEAFDLIVGAEREVRPLDIDQIVKTQEHEALKTMPRAPTPRVPRGAFGGVFDLSQSMTASLSSLSGASDEELHAFMEKVRKYGEELRVWLDQLQASRHERLRDFSAVARVCEGGQAPADFARLRLRFPEEFEEPEQPPEVPEPPERPEFVGRYGLVGPRPYAVPRLARGALSRLIPRPEEFRGAGAEYSREDGSTIIALNIGHINQHDHRDTAEFALRAAPPGTYEVEWQISADGLSPPTEGTIKVEVREPAPGEPIIELRDALAERKHHSLD
jgi:hypothetical protein